MGMDEYIKREAILCMVQPDGPSDEKAAITIATAKKLIRSLAYRCPTADVAPVRHGRWNDWEVFWKECSCCQYRTQKINAREYFFCPKCGAKMNLE